MTAVKNLPALPENADVTTCIDDALEQVCDAIVHRPGLPDDILHLLYTTVATLAVAQAFLRKDKSWAPAQYPKPPTTVM